MLIGEIAALGTAFCWVVSSTSFEYSGKRVGTLVLNLMRLIVAFLIISVINFFLTDGFRNTGLTTGGIGYLMISGIIGFVLGDLFLFQAYIEIGARISLLIMSMAPPLTAVMGYLILGETLTLMQMVGMAVTLSGIALVVLGKEKGSNRVVIRHPVKGLTFAFLGAFGQGLGMIFSKLGVKDLNPFVATEVRILTGIICFAGIITFTRSWSNFNSALKDRKTMTGISIGSLFGPVVGVSLSLLAVKHTSTGVASTLMGVVPVLILPVSILFFKEKVAFKEVLGAIIGVAGVGIMFLR